MITEITDGGAAFPSVSATGYVENGMTLRDYFAGQALAGWLAAHTDTLDHPVAAGCHEIVATNAYEMADAMIAARGGAK